MERKPDKYKNIGVKILGSAALVGIGILFLQNRKKKSGEPSENSTPLVTEPETIPVVSEEEESRPIDHTQKKYGYSTQTTSLYLRVSEGMVYGYNPEGFLTKIAPNTFIGEYTGNKKEGAGKDYAEFMTSINGGKYYFWCDISTLKLSTSVPSAAQMKTSSEAGNIIGRYL